MEREGKRIWRVLYGLFIFTMSMVFGMTTSQAAVSDYSCWEREDGVEIYRYEGSDRDLVIPESISWKPVKEIYSYTFMGDLSNASLRTVLLPEGLEKIGDYAFVHNSALHSINLPPSLTEIGMNPFSNCGIMSFTIEEGNDSFYVEDGALFSKPDQRIIYFPGYYAEKKYEVPQGIRIIGGDCFNFSNLEEIVLPESVQEIQEDAFSYSDIQKINLPDGLVAIEDSVFKECDELKEILIPETVERIGKEAFGTCRGISELALPEYLQEIGEDAFIYCRGIVRLTLPKNSCTFVNNPFKGCHDILKVIIPEDNKQLTYEGGMLLLQDTNTVLAFIKDTDAPIVPEGMKTIGNGAFWGSSLKSISLPDSLEIIEEDAFFSCDFLEEIHVPENVRTIGETAFYGCEGLKRVYIPERVTRIERDAFGSCHPSLTIVAEPDTYAAKYAQQNGIPCVSATGEGEGSVSQGKNVDALIDFLRSNGEYKEGKYSYYDVIPYEDSAHAIIEIAYDILEDALVCTKFYQNDTNDILTTITFSLPQMTEGIIDDTFWYKDDLAYNAKGVISVRDYKYVQTCPCVIAYNVGVSEENIQNMFDSNITQAIMLLDDLLQEELNMGVKDLGFVNLYGSL